MPIPIVAFFMMGLAYFDYFFETDLFQILNSWTGGFDELVETATLMLEEILGIFG